MGSSVITSDILNSCSSFVNGFVFPLNTSNNQTLALAVPSAFLILTRTDVLKKTDIKLMMSANHHVIFRPAHSLTHKTRSSLPLNSLFSLFCPLASHQAKPFQTTSQFLTSRRSTGALSLGLGLEGFCRSAG